MTDTVHLFDPDFANRIRTAPATPARRTDPDTSHEAARMPGRGTDRWRALDVLARCPDGLTDFELGDLMHRQQTSAGKRRGELATVGLVEWSGEYRRAPSGARARVWQVTPAGRRLLRDTT